MKFDNICSKLVFPFFLTPFFSVASTELDKPSFIEVKEYVRKNAKQVPSIDLRDLNSQTGSNLKASPPYWKQVTLRNSGNGWQTWTGKTKMILLDGEIFPAAVIAKKYGENCTIKIEPNRVYGCYYKKEGVTTTTQKKIGECWKEWERDPAWYQVGKPTKAMCDLVDRLNKKAKITNTTTKYTIDGYTVNIIFEKYGDKTYEVRQNTKVTSPPIIVDGRVNALFVLIGND